MTDPLDLAAEERAAARARLALLWVMPLQCLTYVAVRAQFTAFVDAIRELDSETDTFSVATGSFATAFAQLGQLGTLAVAVLFLVWFHRSCVNAHALGLPARRQPALAVASFAIPIVNLWWPYQSTCDLFPPERPRARVLRWFLLWIAGGFVAGLLVVGSAFVDGALAALLLVAAGVQGTLAAFTARQVIADALDEHGRLAHAVGRA